MINERSFDLSFDVKIYVELVTLPVKKIPIRYLE